MRYLCFIFCLAFFACDENSPLDLKEVVNTDETVEEYILTHRYTNDTIDLNATYTLDSSRYLETSKMYLNAKNLIKFEAPTPLVDNHYRADKIEKRPLSLDSLRGTDLAHLDTLQPPNAFAITPVKTRVRHPRSRTVLPWSEIFSAQYDIQHIKTNQGLPTNDINCLLQDEDDFIWFGTPKGLCRFDGKRIKVYDQRSGLPDQDIQSIYQDKEGSIWLGTSTSGLVKFKDNYFYTYTTDSIYPKIPIRFITEDQNNELWFLPLFGGAAYLKNDTIYSYKEAQGILSKRPVNKVLIDSKNNKTFVANNWGIYRLINNRMAAVKDGGGFIPSGLIDSKNKLWLGGWENNLFSLIENDTIYKFGGDERYDHTFVNHIKEDGLGRIWMSSYTAGLFMLDGMDLYRFGVDEGMSSIYIVDFIIDKEDRIWIATSDGGLNLFNPNSFKIQNKYSGFSNHYVNKVIKTNDSTELLATDNGIFTLQNNMLQHPLMPEKNATVWMRRERKFTDVIQKEDTLWLVSENSGIERIVGNEIIRMGGGMRGAPQNPTALAADKNGNIWVSSIGTGMFHIIGDSMVSYQGKHGIAYRNIIRLFCDSENRLWAGSHNMGVAQIVNGNVRYFTSENGLGGNEINDIKEDDNGRVWIATDKGVAYYLDGNLYRVGQDLKGIGENVFSLIQDENGQYWFATEKGLVRLLPKNKQRRDEWNINDYEVIYETRNNLIKNLNFIAGSMSILDGELLIGSTNGLIRWPIENVKSTAEPPLLYIDNILLGRGESLLNDNCYDGVSYNLAEESKSVSILPENLVLPYEENDLTIEFSGLYWRNPDGLKLECRLVGFDDHWVTTDHVATYKNLDYGKYKFELRTLTSNEESATPITFEFEILPPWYHTLWARLLYAVLFVFIIFLFIQWRTRKLKLRQQELEEEVKTATHEIRQQKDEIEEAHREITDSIAYAKRIQTAILPPLKLVKQYVKNSFILYIPKDVVAGDFYWMQSIEEEDGVLFAAADCTGHGVPGAMVSVVCNHALNRAVREFNLTKPGEILDKARVLVLEEFDKSEEVVKDGMDIALCYLQGNKLSYAGAHNPLWIIRKNEKNTTHLEQDHPKIKVNSIDEYTLIEVKADKQPIGKFHNPSSFETHEIELQKNDTIYIFSDGYIDQFGGPRGKKFKPSQFKQLLIDIQSRSLDKQKQLLEDAFIAWKGNLDQLDDICVIGVRV